MVRVITLQVGNVAESTWTVLKSYQQRESTCVSSHPKALNYTNGVHDCIFLTEEGLIPKTTTSLSVLKTMGA